MSRIDEALKRSSQGPLPGRGSSHRSTETPLRLAEELTLNEYPVEVRAGAVHGERAEASAADSASPASARKERPFVPGHGVSSQEKLVVVPEPDAVSIEQFRRLAATLHDLQVAKGLKTVMVTSAVPKEGKTLTVANLALTLSESYRRRVLVIDADLRRPSIHHVLGASNDRGLSDVLRADRMEPPIIQVSSHLAVLPGGRPDPDPMGGLSSPRMGQVLASCAAGYDWVLLDTPPIGLLSDAQLLVRLTQAALFVIRAGSTPFSDVERAIDELGREHIIGTVLNCVDRRTIPANDYYGSYYGASKR